MSTATLRMKSPLDVKDIDHAHGAFDQDSHRGSKGGERASLVQAVLAKTSPDQLVKSDRRSSAAADPSKHAKLKKIKQAMNTLVDKPTAASTAAGGDSKRESIPPTITSEELAQLSSLLGVNRKKQSAAYDDNEETKSKYSLGSLEREQETTASEPTTTSSGSRSAPSRRQAPQRTRSRSLTELDRRKKEKRRGKKKGGRSGARGQTHGSRLLPRKQASQHQQQAVGQSPIQV